MNIKYDVVVTISNVNDKSTSKFTKTLESTIEAINDDLLYDNCHIIGENVYLFDIFSDELNAYIKALGITISQIQFEEFEVVSLTDNVDVFFEFSSKENEQDLKPTIKCYVHPKNKQLDTPTLKGIAYDSRTIIWTWENDNNAHYLVEEAIDVNDDKNKNKIIAQLPIGVNSYTETGLEPDTVYIRRLISYTNEQTSSPSVSCSVRTNSVEISHVVENYKIPKNYDFTTNDSERDIIQERLQAFHSGIGDFTDLEVYKQMDSDFYQKFKAYFELTGKRTQRERRYEQVGFNYKICLEAKETIEEQEGEVTFDINAYPREWATIEDYIWVTKPIRVRTKITASVFLRKEVESQEEEEIQIYQPSYGEITTDPVTMDAYFAKPSAIIISIDCSGSMKMTLPNGQTRIGLVREAVVKLITDISNKVEQTKNTVGEENLKKLIAPYSISELVQFIIIKWGTYHEVVYSGYDASEAINNVKNIVQFPNADSKAYTNFYEGLNAGWQYIKHNPSQKREVVGQIFFTDGFSNVYTKNMYTGESYGTSASIVDNTYTPYHGAYGHSGWVALESICVEPPNDNYQTYVIFANGVTYLDSASSYQNFPTECRTLASGIVIRCGGKPTHTAGEFSTAKPFKGLYKCYYPGDNVSMDSMTVESLASSLIDGLQMFKTESVIVQEGTHEEFFNGWQLQPEQVASVNTYSLDDIKVVTVTDEYDFEFNNSVTPVIYSRKEKRAIIPSSSILPPTKLSNVNIYDLIMNKVKQTPEWQDGYNNTIGTIEPNGEEDKFLIKGLHIQNSYAFADEDIVPDLMFTEYEDGMEGSVNSFTDIDKANTSTYGDDCYLISKSNYLKIQGYTDAIIFDGNRFVTAELNAYDRPSVILVSKDAIYNNEIFNRKNSSIQYTGSGPYSHVIDIIQKDDDVYYTGYSELVKVGDWLLISPLTNDLIAHNDRWYKSPVLNYRFNLEDPDAKTSIYEILPDCDPNNDYRHIVILHVYYAKNVYISSKDNYVSSFGSSPLANENSPYIPLVENYYKWTLREWRDKQENGWYIDNYLWFMSKKMTKTQDYYDELPGPNMEDFYGLVNGRYRSDNQSGKHDLIVDTPQFNIPTTVHSDTIKIYIVITEFYPETAIVSYKWEHPWNDKDNITQFNGDYVTFSSDNITYKDVEYFDIISTINMENQEIFDNKTTEKIFVIEKPNTIYDYTNYYLKVTTNNADVLALRYPNEITFDENNQSEIGVSFKGVVNATSKWSPRIHNGYYYINQHEYFAYSEFNVQANFDTVEEINYKTINGYISIDVTLRKIASPTEEYSITKDTRSELLQDERYFIWSNGKGVTLKPYIDGMYYKDYKPYMYYTPIITFPNKLTTADRFNVTYSIEDGSTYLPMEIRSYDLENGKWGEWTTFVNNTVPNVPLSHAYQARFMLQASTTNKDLEIEDYLCCYLDWKDDMNEENTVNIVTITDYMTTGPYKNEGIFISKIIDYGCVTDIQLDIFQSHYKKYIQLYIATSDKNEENLLLENINWINISNSSNSVFSGRFIRYKIVIPEGEKLYWLYKKIITQKTDVILPYVSSVSMSGTYEPKDIVVNFINTESFEIPKDGEYHIVFNKVSDLIMSDILNKGFEENEIEKIVITCTTENIDIKYDANLDNPYPAQYLSSPIQAMSDVDTEIIINNTPYIFVEKDETEQYDIIKIIGTPQQFSPITVEDENGNAYIQLYNTTSFIQTYEHITLEDTKYIELPTNRYDSLSMVIKINDDVIDDEKFNIINHLIIFNEFISAGNKITVEYCILYSFIAEIDREKNTTILYIHTGENIEIPKKLMVHFETNEKNNKFIANDLSLNPIYRTDYKGFIYMTDDHNEPYKINIYCNPTVIKAGGYDKVDVSVEVLDILNNPVIFKEVAIDCSYGILNCDNYETDMNGVVHFVYESAYTPCTDNIHVRVLDSSNNVIESSLEIINND